MSENFIEKISLLFLFYFSYVKLHKNFLVFLFVACTKESKNPSNFQEIKDGKGSKTSCLSIARYLTFGILVSLTILLFMLSIRLYTADEG